MDAAARKLLMGELIGKEVVISASKNACNEGLRGTIIDETRNTLTIRAKGGEKMVVKKENIFTFTVDKKAFTVDGGLIAKRPEERTKETR